MSQVSNEIGGQYEAQFRLAGCEFEYVEDYPIASINIVPLVQVRRHDVAPSERVNRYQEQMAAGAHFPPLTIRHNDGALLDGNTRLNAMANLGRSTVEVYRVKPRNDEHALMIAGALNQLGGKDLELDDVKVVALIMVRQGVSAADVSRKLGVSAARVTRWQAVETGRVKARSLNVEDEFMGATQNVQEQLAKVVRNDAFSGILDVVSDHKPVAGELKQLVKKVNEVGTDSEALEAIEHTAQAWPQGNGMTKSVAMAASAPIGQLLKHESEHWVDVVKYDTLFPKWEELAQLATAVVESYIAQAPR